MLEWDVRHGDHADVDTLSDPGPDDVERALRRLDQRRHTELTLFGDDGQYLNIGGGVGCYYVFVAAVEHDDSVVLQASTPKTGFEELVTGGQRMRLPAGSVVGLAEAWRAAAAFLRTGGADPALSWGVG